MLFNQQQCFIYSTASFLSKLRAKKVEKLHNSSFYRNFRKLYTGIGFRKRLFPVLSIIKKKKIKKINPDWPTLDFFWHVSVNTHIFFFGLRVNSIRVDMSLHTDTLTWFFALSPCLREVLAQTYNLLRQAR